MNIHKSSNGDVLTQLPDLSFISILVVRSNYFFSSTFMLGSAGGCPPFGTSSSTPASLEASSTSRLLAVRNHGFPFIGRRQVSLSMLALYDLQAGPT